MSPTHAGKPLKKVPVRTQPKMEKITNVEVTEQEKELTQKESVDILTRLQVVLKISRVYESNNLVVLEQMDQFFMKLNDALAREGEIVLRQQQNAFYMKGLRVKFDYSNYHVYKFLQNELSSKEIAAIGFSHGLTQEEIRRFITIFNSKELEAKTAYDKILHALGAEEVEHITIEKMAPAESLQSREKDAVRLYFSGIYLLKEVFDKQKTQGTFNLNLTKRWMQSIFNYIVDDESFIYGLTNIKNYEEYTLNHSINVCILAIALGRRLGLSREELLDLGVSSFLHDLGKLDIPREILDKPGELSQAERAVIENHVHIGAEKLIQLKSARRIPVRAVQVALEHHLKADLSGYPKYFKKRSTNLFSKIVKIVDYFDAITTKRVYRAKVFTREDALRLMLEKSGEEFDPLILKVFISMIGAYPVGSLVALDTGELGIVFEVNPHPAFHLRPKVKIIADADGNKVDGEISDLTEIAPETKKFGRTIIKSLDADKYGIQPADYFLAKAE
jgi:HD-GYP domain-containing protein (c-di-GMP phosphodiesterase class II)